MFMGFDFFLLSGMQHFTTGGGLGHLTDNNVPGTKVLFLNDDIKLHKNIFVGNIFKYYVIILVLDPPTPQRS